MVTQAVSCPHCGQVEPVIRHGVHRNQTPRCFCKACQKTFTPQPRSRRVTPERERAIRDALSERLSIDAIARMLRCSKSTIYAVLKKTDGGPSAAA